MAEKIYEKQDVYKGKRPKICQNVIPISKVYENGIFLHKRGRYSATYKLKDIDYKTQKEDIQRDIIGKWCDCLNTFKGSADTYKLTLYNRRTNIKDKINNTFIRTDVEDGFDHWREEHNKMEYEDIVKGGIDKGIYLTVNSYKRNPESAEAAFSVFGMDLDSSLQEIGSSAEMMNCVERLRLFNDFFRPGYEMDYQFSYTEDNARYFKSYICPESAEFNHSSYIMLNGMYGRSMMIKAWSDSIKDEFFDAMTNISPNMAITLDILPFSTVDSKKFVAEKEASVEGSVNHWNNRLFKMKNSRTRMPNRLKNQRDDIDIWNEDIHKRGQKVFLCQITIVFLADTMKELEYYSESVTNTANEHGFSVGILWQQQLDGLRNALPFGVRTIENLRDCNTETTAIIMPFSTAQTENCFGIPFGRHLFTKKQHYVNVLEQANGHTFVLGSTGYGKSMGVKKKQFYKLLRTSGDIIIFDPDGEYTPFVEEAGGQVIYLGKDNINVMELPEDVYWGDKDVIADKSNYVLCLIEAILGSERFGEVEKSIADRCIRNVLKLSFQNYYERQATLFDWLEEVKSQPEPEAVQLALSMERHIIGSFDCFAKPSSVKREGRIICYNMSQLPKQLKDAGMMVALEDANQKVDENYILGKYTFLEMDEADYYFKHATSRSVIENFFERVRKRNGIMTILIQTLDKVLIHPEARTMLSLCDNVVMMHQEEMVAKELKSMYNLSDKQYNYLLNAKPGCGINKIGNFFYMFDDTIAKDAWLYKYINTDKKRNVA